MADLEEPEKQKRLEIFILKHKERISMWEKSHPGYRAPIYWDIKKQEFFWLNRRQRRK